MLVNERVDCLELGEGDLLFSRALWRGRLLSKQPKPVFFGEYISER